MRGDAALGRRVQAREATRLLADLAGQHGLLDSDRALEAALAAAELTTATDVEHMAAREAAMTYMHARNIAFGTMDRAMSSAERGRLAAAMEATRSALVAVAAREPALVGRAVTAARRRFGLVVP